MVDRETATSGYRVSPRYFLLFALVRDTLHRVVQRTLSLSFIVYLRGFKSTDGSLSLILRKI